MVRGRRAQATLHGPRDDTPTHDRRIIEADWMPLVWINDMDFNFKRLQGTVDDGLNAWRRVWRGVSA